MPNNNFKNKQRPLTPLMIRTLLRIIVKQKENVPFGQRDIKGSFGVLVERGLIESKPVMVGGQTEHTWEVTKEAVEMLEKQGIKIPD